MLVFPVDYITADKFDKDANTGTATDKEGIPADWQGIEGRLGPPSKLFKLEHARGSVPQDGLGLGDRVLGRLHHGRQV
jgi:hypothetical protein